MSTPEWDRRRLGDRGEWGEDERTSDEACSAKDPLFSEEDESWPTNSEDPTARVGGRELGPSRRLAGAAAAPVRGESLEIEFLAKREVSVRFSSNRRKGQKRAYMRYLIISGTRIVTIKVYCNAYLLSGLP